MFDIMLRSGDLIQEEWILKQFEMLDDEWRSNDGVTLYIVIGQHTALAFELIH